MCFPDFNLFSQTSNLQMLTANKMAASPESQYLDLCQQIIATGSKREDRTGTGTMSLFAPPQLRFKLNVFPLLTTKRVFLRPVFEELMFFIRGQTDGNILSQKDVHIWEQNGSREALDARGLPHRAVNDLGPVYGFQWRYSQFNLATLEPTTSMHTKTTQTKVLISSKT